MLVRMFSYTVLHLRQQIETMLTWQYIENNTDNYKNNKLKLNFCASYDSLYNPVSWNVTFDMVIYSQETLCILSKYFSQLTWLSPVDWLPWAEPSTRSSQSFSSYVGKGKTTSFLRSNYHVKSVNNFCKFSNSSLCVIALTSLVQSSPVDLAALNVAHWSYSLHSLNSCQLHVVYYPLLYTTNPLFRLLERIHDLWQRRNDWNHLNAWITQPVKKPTAVPF